MVRLFKVAMSPAAGPMVERTLMSGYIGQGPMVEEFEERLRNVLDLPSQPVTTNSATSAIDLALELIGVRKGDYVITTPMTCSATNSPIVKRGAHPVWADVDWKTGLIDSNSVARLLGRYLDVKAIIAVDWGGRRADYQALRSFGIPVIQDAAHTLGMTGGDYTVYSFQAIKHLTTGDGGALLVPADQYDRAKLLRWYGLDRESARSFRCEQDIPEVGFKYHMNDIAATIGLANLPLAIENLEKAKTNAAILSSELDVGFVGRHHYWFFPWLVDDQTGFERRMKDRGIEVSQVHSRNDQHSGFKAAEASIQIARPGLNLFSAHQIALPCGWWLTEEDIINIVKTVKEES